MVRNIYEWQKLLEYCGYYIFMLSLEKMGHMIYKMTHHEAITNECNQYCFVFKCGRVYDL